MLVLVNLYPAEGKRGLARVELRWRDVHSLTMPHPRDIRRAIRQSVLAAAVTAVIGFVCVGAELPPSPFNPGSLPVAPAVNVAANTSTPFDVTVWAPTQPGSYPLVVLVTGFMGNMPAVGYSTVCSNLTKHGYVVAGLSKLQMPNATVEAHAMHTSIAFVIASAPQLLPSGVSLEKGNVAVAAHSGGAHVVVQALEDSCGDVTALLLLDPVDGYDPWGMIPGTAITPGRSLDFSTPMLTIGTGFDPVGVGMFDVACAPVNMSNDRFYNASSGPAWSVNATAYSHINCLDEEYQGVAAMICANHGPGVPNMPYRDTLVGLWHAFLQAVFRGRAEYFDWLVGTAPNATAPVATLRKHDMHGYTLEEAARPFCTRTPAKRAGQ